MRFSPKWLPPLVLLLGLRTAFAADALPDYFPPGTKLVIGIQMRGIIDTLPAGAGAELKIKSAAWLAQTPFAGFDPLKDLDEVLIATSGKGDNPPVLAVLRGRFDVDRLAAKAQRYGGVPIVDAGGQPNSALAFLDSSTAIAGDPALVRAAIDRGGKADAGLPWADRIEGLRGRYPVWGIGDGIERPASTGAQGDPFDSIDRFEFGADFKNGLGLTAEFHLRSSEDAQKMAATLQLLEAMLKSKSNRPPAAGSQFSVNEENGTVRLSVRIPEAELKNAVESQRATLEAAMLSQLPAAFASGAGTKPEPIVVAPPPKNVPSSGSRIVSNAKGDTLVVTLPGANH